MSAIFDEQQQFVDSGGNPVVNGFIYIGDQGADPKLNPKAIFSDRALSVPLANPQRTDANGRSVNKIWTDGRYSMRISDLNDTQLYQELDNGEDAGTVTLALIDVLGANVITADASPTITALVDKAQFIFQVVSQNTTDAVTLNIDGLGAKAIKRSFSLDVGIGRFKVGQTVIVAYNLGNDNFELVNDNRSVILANKGADIASAATVDLSLATGNVIDITGTTTISSFGTVLPGAPFQLTFDGVLTLTYNAVSLILPTSANIITEAGDTAIIQSLGSGNWQVLVYQRRSGSSVGLATQDQAEAGTNNTTNMSPLRTAQAIDGYGGRPEIFTAGGTYQVPDGISFGLVEAVGAGAGGGGAGPSAGDDAGGGGGGGFIRAIVALTPGGSETITIGTGGTGNTGTGTGTAGGNTTFGSKVTANGGAGGVGDAGGGAGGVGGTASTTETLIMSQSGKSGVARDGSNGAGFGANHVLMPANGVSGSGVAATNLSGGGAGGYTANGDGGDGADGYIIVTPLL